MKKKYLSLLLICLFSMLSLCACGEEKEETTADVVETTAAYLCDTVTDPTFGSVGGDWVIIGLARSGYDVPTGYFDTYYDNVVSYVEDCGGVLDETKNTEYSRLVLALTAIGEDPTDVAGYNMLLPLADFEKTVSQGINGPIWALIALDAGNYEIPQDDEVSVQATRELYINEILSRQLDDGGFALSSGTEEDADADITAMVITALANYTDRSDVAAALEDALSCLASMQTENAGFTSWDQENAETDAQVVVALCTLGIGMDDVRFTKNGATVVDHLQTFSLGDGSFAHTLSDESADQMATEQAFYALVALDRYDNGISPLFRMAE